MSFSGDLFGAIAEARRPTLELAQELDLPTIARPWLQLQFQVTRATSQTLDYAIGRCDRAMHQDGFDNDLCTYFERKSVDEDGHGEMLLSDLMQAGIEGIQAHHAPNPSVAEMCGRQFYLLAFHHPAAYLGYVALLEGFVPTPAQVNALAEGSGLPAIAFRTIRMHAGADVGHKKELAEMLDVTPARLQPLIISNSLRCAALQREALEILQANQETEMRR